MLRRIWLTVCVIWSVLCLLLMQQIDVRGGYEWLPWFAALPWIFSYCIPFLVRFVRYGDPRRRRPVANYWRSDV
jgi:hypothetical protein